MKPTYNIGLGVFVLFFVAASVASAQGGAVNGVIDSKYDDKQTKLVDREEGKGTVKLRNKKNNKLLETVKVFKDGGVDSRRVSAGERGAQEAIAAIQEAQGRFMKMYNLDGRFLARRKLANKNAVHEFDSGALKSFDNSQGEQYMVTARLADDNTKAVVQVLRYNIDTRSIDRVAQGTVAGFTTEDMDGGFGVEIEDREIHIADENDDVVKRLKLNAQDKLVAVN